MSTGNHKVSTATGILIEAEDFDNYGGWLLDSQFEAQMGSPYLLAHGLGKPVADASTTGVDRGRPRTPLGRPRAPVRDRAC